VGKIDLHLHSTASDGRLSPAELVRRAAEAGLSVMALTDHDTVAGIAPALAAVKAYPRLEFIPGVEINTDVPRGEAHVLGYFIDYAYPELLVTLSSMRESRQERAQKMLAKLKGMGISLEWSRVKEIASTEAIGRPHIAQAMLEKGYITSIKEAFTKYIGWGGPAYVERDKVMPGDAVQLILRANGLPVLGHPLTISEPEPMIAELKANGLVGLEAYYGGYSAAEVSRLVSLAEKYGLITTGGSDYHGLDDSTETPIGEAGVPAKSVQQLIALAEQRALKLVPRRRKTSGY
jgi:predicted metal-dependent phosphoesterase TrpH